MRLGDLDALRLTFVEKREKAEKCIHDKVDRAVTKIALGWCIDKTAAAPTIDPEDLRPKAKWKLHKNGDGTCSRCHFTQTCVWDYDNWQKYCGHCGAHMTDAN